MILALDLGKHCGYAVGDTERLVTSGTRTLRKGEDKIEDMCWMLEALRAEHPAIRRVVYETSTGPSYKSHAPQLSAIMLRSAIVVWSVCRQVPRQYVPAPTLKSALGWRRKQWPDAKQFLDQYARAAWPQAVITSQDQADALCVLSYAIEQEREKIPRRRRAR